MAILKDKPVRGDPLKAFAVDLKREGRPRRDRFRSSARTHEMQRAVQVLSRRKKNNLNLRRLSGRGQDGDGRGLGP